MSIVTKSFVLCVACAAVAAGCAAAAAPAEAPARIGVYDSRAVALSYLRSRLHAERLDALLMDAEMAKRRDDKARVEALEAQGKARQHLAHMQVFGNAPIPDILKDLEATLAAEAEKHRLALIVRDVDIAWRVDSLDVIDITEALVARFEPSAETRKIIKEMAAHPPLPLEQFPIDCDGGAKSGAAAKPPSPERAGRLCADHWVWLLDREMYAGGWEDASARFRETVPKQTWLKDIEKLRGGLGKANARTMKSCRVTAGSGGAAGGERVTVQFETTFERKEKAVETVVVVRDPDGTWRVDGYSLD